VSGKGLAVAARDAVLRIAEDSVATSIFPVS
jgi:hypothetical protein